MNETIINITNVTSEQKTNITFIEVLIYTWIFMYLLSYIDKNKGKSQRKSRFTEKKALHNKKIFDPSLKNIIGLESVKDEIRYYMDFINNKEKYKKWNVKLPKGILLAGPPGTGKTLLVKTMAESLDIPIVSACGSEFVEMYVGVGASRIRELFEKAKKYEKCIIFIDEIDAVGKKRGYDNNSERDNTLNQLLVEMDGFDDNDNIMVFAATNMIRKLDRALTRSGRFDKKIYFDPPNFKERKQLFQLYLKNIEYSQSLTLDILAERTAGLTGADIASACNQAKINAIQNDKEICSLNEIDIQNAIDEIMIGREKRERSMNQQELERVSHHEAGHAIIGYLLANCSQPVKVSIVPRGEAALGFSQQKSNDNKLLTEDMVLSKIAVLLGGRCAEKLIYDNYSTGAYDDIEKLTNLAINYSGTWGLNKNIGPLNLQLFYQYGENIQDINFNESHELVLKIENWVFKVLKKYKRYVISLANQLIKNETIDYNTIKKILPTKAENSLVIKL
jgi:ATP-dependent metalloprotease FtsH